jgi:RNA polymerase sigma-70 factor (ECF subfamily)
MVIYLTPSRNQVDATFGTVIQGVVPIQADRDAAFERRLEDHYLDLLRLAVLLARNLAEAQDALQTALERAWRSREQLREEDRLDPWLKRIVIREVLRRQTSPWSRFTRPATVVDLSRLASSDGDSATNLDVLAAIGRLPVAQRAVVVLHHYAGYPVDEISAITGAPVETVRSRLRLAMARLRTELAR